MQEYSNHYDDILDMWRATSPLRHFAPCPFKYHSHQQEDNIMTTKLAVFDAATVESDKVYTLRLRQAGTFINLDVVDPDTGNRLMDGTLMRFYPNGKVTYKIMNGCKQGGVHGRIAEHRA